MIAFISSADLRWGIYFHFSDGIGCERTVNPQTNLLMNDFIGSFRNGKKHGEGRCFLEDGVYEGDWHRNQRSGCGMMWYKNGELYAGEWKNDKYHGAGVLVKGKEALKVKKNAHRGT